MRGAVSYVSAGGLAKQVAHVLKMDFSVDPPLANLRVSLNTTGIAPKPLADALGALLNGSTAITVRQTSEQRAAEDKLAAKDSDQRDDVTRLSDRLKEALADFLSPAQKQAYANGDKVNLALGDLPPSVRALADQYVQMSWDRLQSARPGGGGEQLDIPGGDFSLTLWNVGQEIGVIQKMPDGRNRGF
ncbi:MAG: hypothetical protein LC772_12605 [Chloroflexi bacterium]|nr:hypothetical protein [Chloroflexota bacterium]